MDGTIQLFAVVALTVDLPEHHLRRGEVGTVVEVLADGAAFEVEFSDDEGQTTALLALLPEQFRVVHEAPSTVEA